MSYRKSTVFVLYFMKAHPFRSAIMVVLLALAGVAEGLGIAALLPLLNVAMSAGDVGGDDRITRLVMSGFSAVGISPTLPAMLGIVVAGVLGKAGFLWLGMTQVGYTVAAVVAELRLRLTRALLRARWSFFVQQQVGHLTNGVTSESHRAAFAYREACTAMAAVAQIIMFLAVALLISWHVALASVVIGVALAFGLRTFVDRTRRAGEDQTSLMDSLTGRLTDLIVGMKALKAMGLEEEVTPFLAERVDRLQDAQRRQIRALESLRLIQEPVVVLLMAAGVLGAVTVGIASFAEIMVLAVVFYRILGYFNALQLRLQSMAEGESAFWSLMRKIEKAERASESWPGKTSAPAIEESIVWERVRFGYGEKEILKGVEVEMQAGTFISVVGDSGAGKTTMVDILAGLLRPTEGRILVDGVDLHAVALPSWKKVVGYVPQDLLLFHGTVRDNVALGLREARDVDVLEALRLAGAEEFVDGLPDGLDTHLGERAVRLSGGQRQRLALARALVRRPRLLLLDEVTAALDAETELQIAQVLRGLVGRTTVVSISHRPELQRVSDVVLKLKDGLVREVTAEVSA